MIIITAKKVRSGKTRFNFTTTNSVSEITDKVDVLNGDQVRDVVNRLGTAAQKAQLGTANTDWQSQIYQTARSTDNNLSITGGIGSVPFRVSIGYLNHTNADGTPNTNASRNPLAMLYDWHDNSDAYRSIGNV